MTFAIVYKACVFLFALNAAWPLIFSDELSVVIPAAFGGFFVSGWFLDPPVTARRSYRTGASILVLALFIVSVFRIAHGVPLARAVMGFTVFLLGVKLCTRNDKRDYAHLLILSFVVLVASTVVGYDLAYGVHFLLFILMAPLVMSMTYLRAQIEERFTKDPEAILRLLNSRRLISSGYVTTITLMAIPLLAVTMALFLAIPRLGLGIGGNPLLTRLFTGFGDAVSIGAISDAANDHTVFLRVTTPDGRDTLSSQERRFRGPVYHRYAQGTWHQGDHSSFVRLVNSAGAVRIARTRRPTRTLKITQQPTRPTYLFYPYGTALIEPDTTRNRGTNRWRRLRINRSGVITYGNDKTGGISYTAVTGARELPAGNLLTGADYLQLPRWRPDVLAKLNRLVDIYSNGESEKDRVRSTVTAIRTRYRYNDTLPTTTSAVLDADVNQPDPVLTFLFDAEGGTCEHFATATALLLRLQGIRTRFVTGFAGADWNGLGQYYMVTAGHAHAWVEAFYDGQWHTLDPTPGRAIFVGVRDGKTSFSMSMLFDTLAMKWSEYVVDYDLDTQFEMLKRTEALLSRWWLPTDPPSFVLIAGMIVVVLMALGVIVAVRRRVRYRRLPLGGSRPHRRGGQRDLMKRLYLKLERRIATQTGIPRTSSETPLAYIQRTTPRIHDPRAVADAIMERYRTTRFSTQPLSRQQYGEWVHLVKTIRAVKIDR